MKNIKKRIIFVNLHGAFLLLRVAMSYIFKFSAAIKHGYILRYLLDNPDKFEVCNYISDEGFTLYTGGPKILVKTLSKFAYIENKITLLKNGINPSKIKVLTRPDQLKKDDIVIMYNASGGLSCMNASNVFKAVSMIHFHGKQGESDAINNAGVNCIFNEVNLQDSSEIFRRFYDINLPWIVHPFVFAERFKNVKPFKERKNKCFSTGTITYKSHQEFIEVYGDPCDQPARKFVKNNPEFFKNTVDCYNSDYLEDNPGKKFRTSDNAVVKLYKKIYNRTHVGKQKRYFSFDMVEKFNEYKMHLIGEEILGVPGIGFVEGMACGSAYIGLDSPMYRNYGLIPGEHYITYDGTKEGLKKTVEYWQRPENQIELEAIAKRGCDFVRENFRGEKVAKKLINDLIEQQQKWQTQTE